MAPETPKFRFIKESQLAYMKNLRLPTLIVLIGYSDTGEGPWYFATTTGPIPQPIPNDVAQEVVRCQKPAWRIVPGGLAIAVESVPAKKTQFEAFEKWLTDNGYPFDRIE